METVITGSPTISDIDTLIKAADDLTWVPTKIIVEAGHYNNTYGVGKIGETWGKNLKIPVELVKTDYEAFGRSATYIKNRSMVRKAKAVIALWDGKSLETKHIINIAVEMDRLVYVWIV